ncbi:hypothetical protein GCM10007384_20420 [Aquimarina muelleri]|uniref:Uncharacterized protein n=1 Tax=Aquimarina muelleri TaxID=279356 RepID=A0A918JV74_9FLAO|nr:hypothetical protein GCM10007384_20420 [Aquimarina muelleri]
MFNLKKIKIMKTISYILIALFITVSFTSCTADRINDNEDISLEQFATGDGEIDPDDVG